MIAIVLGALAGFLAVLVLRPETLDEHDTTKFLESLGDEQLDAIAEILDDEQMDLFGRMLERRAIEVPVQEELN
jgi:hypothetical protein